MAKGMMHRLSGRAAPSTRISQGACSSNNTSQIWSMINHFRLNAIILPVRLKLSFVSRWMMTNQMYIVKCLSPWNIRNAVASITLRAISDTFISISSLLSFISLYWVVSFRTRSRIMPRALIGDFRTSRFKTAIFADIGPFVIVRPYPLGDGVWDCFLKFGLGRRRAILWNGSPPLPCGPDPSLPTTHAGLCFSSFRFLFPFLFFIVVLVPDRGASCCVLPGVRGCLRIRATLLVYRVPGLGEHCQSKASLGWRPKVQVPVGALPVHGTDGLFWLCQPGERVTFSNLLSSFGRIPSQQLLSFRIDLHRTNCI